MTPDPVLTRLAESAKIPDLSDRLAALGPALALEVEAVDLELASAEGDRDHLAARAARHLLARPGKRLRASCALLAARLGGAEPGRAAIELAIAAELVHAATLLHDDVIDDGSERRGAPASRVVFGNSASVLGGDHLLVEALRRVNESRAPGALASLLAAIAEMVAAEALQLERREEGAQVIREAPERRFEAYREVARGKTAALFRWALGAGASLAGLDERGVTAAGRFGASLGLAFQLVDDALDLDGDPAQTGKLALADLREGKLSWPLLVALEREPSLGAALLSGDPSIAAAVRATGAVEATRTEAQRHLDRGLAALSELPPSAARSAFEVLARASLERRS